MGGGNERGKNSECKASETYLVLKFRIIKPNSRLKNNKQIKNLPYMVEVTLIFHSLSEPPQEVPPEHLRRFAAVCSETRPQVQILLQ